MEKISSEVMVFGKTIFLITSGLNMLNKPLPSKSAIVETVFPPIAEGMISASLFWLLLSAFAFPQTPCEPVIVIVPSSLL